MTDKQAERPWILDRFDDIRVLRYEVPGFEALPLNEKIYIYYLAKAAEAGRDIIYDQNFKYNVDIRDIFETIIKEYQGDRTAAEWKAVERYAKHIWFANGIHHHYSGAKFTPQFSKEYLNAIITSIATFDSEKLELVECMTPVIFDPELYKTRVAHDQEEAEATEAAEKAQVDLIARSACNYYDGVTQEEAEKYYQELAKKSDPKISLGLNSQLAKDEHGNIFERVYKLDGLYSHQIEQIIFWLEKAHSVANETQQQIIELLIEYYRTGELKKFDDYSIAWVNDNDSNVDFINGFIEVYGDPLCRKASWEALVNFKNKKASKRTETIAQNAQWFENHAPINPQYRKEKVTGVSAKVITAAMLGGDCYPATPIGINLPNAEWIRRDHGSKSVTIDNITHAYAEAAKGGGFTEEFFIDKQTQNIIQTYAETADALHTDLHECLGHGSGQLAPGVTQDALGAYHSTIEECRADLFGLYFMADKKMVELGLIPTIEAAKAHYIKYLTNGAMTQLARIELGQNVEQTHMRNRKIIAEWILERGEGVAEMVEHEQKKYITVTNFERLREMFGELLYEIQRMKSEGDIAAAKQLVEKYGIKIDQSLHKEILERYKALNIEPYNGFVNPTYTLVMEAEKIIDVDITYPTKIW